MAVTQSPTQNPYLEGDFAPVAEEQTISEVAVTGELPGYLDGRFLRNGPNPLGAIDPATYHWFLGTGMVHGLRIQDGRVDWYRNRWVRSKGVAKQLGEQPHPGPIHAGFDFPANTHVIGFAGRTLALVEGGARPYELDRELGTVGPCDFDGTLPGGYTAHPLVDPATGEMHAVSYYYGWGRHVQYSITGPDGRVRRNVDIEVTGSPMMHAFTLTEHHVVIYDLPVSLDMDKIAKGGPRPMPKPMAKMAGRFLGRTRIPASIATTFNRMTSGQQSGFPYWWNPDYPARVGVMPRQGGAGDVRWFDVEPCFVYHPLNGYDEPGHIVLDVVRHPKTFATEQRGPNEGAPTLDRWTIDLAAGKVREERLDDRGQEFPRLDDRLVGRRHRYGWSVGFDDQTTASNLFKHDVVTGTTAVRDFGPDCELDEFVFVPRNASEGAAAGEDDGVVMGFVYHRDTDTSDLAVLDAGSLEPVATVHLPVRVPHGFHGSWVPTAIA